MLRVRNLPPEPDWRDWLREEGPTIRGLGLSAVTAICLAILLGGQPDSPAWTLLTPVDGVTVTTPAGSEAQCRAMLSSDEQACVRGDLTLPSL